VGTAHPANISLGKTMDKSKILLELIDTTLKASDWSDHEIHRHRVVATGHLLDNGKRAQPKYADRVLVHRGINLAVIEANKYSPIDKESLEQAKRNAEKLDARFAYSTNGDSIYQFDLATFVEGYISRYPTPYELWGVYREENELHNRYFDQYSDVF
jgi:type I restriction enzyme, R subunit